MRSNLDKLMLRLSRKAGIPEKFIVLGSICNAIQIQLYRYIKNLSLQIEHFVL